MQGRRRRAAALMVAVCTISAACASDGGRSSAVGGPSPSRAAAAAIDPDAVPPCPSWEADPDYPEGPLPTGAVSLRVCPGDDPVARPPVWKGAIAAPIDPLVTGVDALVGEVNALPDWRDEPDHYCSQEGRPRIKYVFGYPDGSTRTITHGYGECHVLELAPPGDFPRPDGLSKQDALGFKARVGQALLAQRAGQQPPDDVPAAPGCVPNIAATTVLPVEDLELATAALCLLPDGRRYRRADLSPGLVRRVEAALDVSDAGPASAPGTCPEIPYAKLVGHSTWGDPVAIRIEGCAFLLWDAEAQTGTYRPLGPDLVADLLALPLGPWVRQR